VNTNVACGSEVGLRDKVAYGSALCAEGSPVAALSLTTGAVRRNDGYTDTLNNAADFTLVTNPVPHNSQSPASAYCLSTPTRPPTWGQLKSFYR
jgi:hypothetical protein